MRVTAVAAAVGIAMVGLALADDARAAIRKPTSIPGQQLGSALRSLAKDRQFQVIFRSELVRDVRTAGAVGELTTDEALTQLLSGTALTFHYLDDKTVTIVPVVPRDLPLSAPEPQTTTSAQGDIQPAQAVAGSEKETPKSFWQRFRLAQSDSTKNAATSSETGSAEAGRLEKSTLEEIVVSAQKREERLQDVPISISVLSGADLDRSTGGGVIDALNRVPGATASPLPQTGASFVTLRGVSSGANVGAGGRTTGYYLDSIPFLEIGSPDMSAYDLSRIEILRGPQGTLYGVNSVSGVVRVLTNEADLEQFEAKTRLTTSLTDGGGTNYRGDAAINVPIVDGRLAARAVVGYEDQSGWLDRANKQDINDGVLRNVRLKIGAQPVDNLHVNLSAWQSHTEYDATSAASDAGTRNVLFDEPLTIDMDIYALALRYDFASFSLSSNTSQLYYDYDSLKRSIFSASFLNSIRDISVFSQEINLTSTAESPLRWNLGAIYLDSDTDAISRTGTATTARSAPLTFAVPPNSTSESAAVFGQIDYRFIDTLELTLGLRYFEDEVTSIPTLTAPRRTAKFHATTPRVGLTWYPSDDLTAYVVYAQGFRSGTQQNLTAQTQYGFSNADPDRLHNYEAGVKGNLFNGLVAFDAATYYMKWDDIQQSLLIPVGATFTSAVINATSASGPGLEISATLQPFARFNVGLSVGWNDLTLDETVFSSGLALYEKGARLNASAAETYSAFIDYSLPLGLAGLEVRLSASANYQSKLTSRTLISGTILTIEGDPILLGRASVAVGPSNDRWSVTLFGDNVTNEDGASLGGWPPPGQEDEGARLRPRTFGAQLEYRF